MLYTRTALRSSLISRAPFKKKRGIYMDLEGIRKHNPEYLNRLDEYGYELNLDDYEVQEEEA